MCQLTVTHGVFTANRQRNDVVDGAAPTVIAEFVRVYSHATDLTDTVVTLV